MTTIRVPAGTVSPDGKITGPEITAQFYLPGYGEVPVKITLFQYGNMFGVGVYPTATNGAVLRWHDGPEAEPRVIHWHWSADGVCH